MELRWDPIMNQWIIVAGKRGKRPLLPEGYCPFCPGAEEVPEKGWKVLSLPNRFPALRLDPPPPDVECDRLYRCRMAEGICEVLIYTPKHDSSFADLTVENIVDIVELWAQRFKELGDRDNIKYVFIFENKGRITGVTLDHPHGQLYAFPFVPPIIRKELSSSRKYMKRTGNCLFCTIIEKERNAASRIVCENPNFVCFLPFFAHWPFGVHVYPKRHIAAITELTEEEKTSFASILKAVTRKFDNLYDVSFPYMMALHQRPTDGKPYPHYHFHVEFYPPYREKNKVKYFASVETGAGTVTFDYAPEMKAKELRETPAT
jgi:UDPglucose--hexose-1-phosphate uridylyltransferase